MIFLNETTDVSWLKETKLSGVVVSDFASFVLYGNEDSPSAVDLYESADPLFDDDFTRVSFVCDSPIYCEIAQYSGSSGKPLGGLSELKTSY